MNTEIFGVTLQVALTLLLAFPLGRYIAKVYKGERSCLDFMKPVERLIYRIAGADPEQDMNWKCFLKALLMSNLFWFAWGLLLLFLQNVLPLNPDGHEHMSFSLAFHTCASFLANGNLQHYTGEQSLSYFTQLFVVMLFQFLTAATGMAALAGVMTALAHKTTQSLGNYWRYLTLSVTRILLPLSLVLGLLLITQGVPMSFDGQQTTKTLEGGVQQVSQGPVAAIVPIKQLGTNGGGFFGSNAAHPLENPTYLTQMAEGISLLLIPMALALSFGYFTRRRKLGYMIFGVMLIAFLAGAAVNIGEEMKGNPAIHSLGIAQENGNMEGKEVRFGSAATGLWSAATTASSNGSANGSFEFLMPLSNLVAMLNMQTNTWFGGVGVGWLNYFTFIIIAVFISGLMVGRTPEFIGKKVEAREMKIAALIAMLPPLLILGGTAIACWGISSHPEWVAADTGGGTWTGNPGFHGLSEMLYQYTSSASDNGSALAGLTSDTTWWNFSSGCLLLIGRFLPVSGQLALAGLLAQKAYTPENAGTLRTDTATFGAMTFITICIVAALSFFPSLTLSAIAEQLTL